tara:strand:- start:4839 stop:5759 length:921 start_codon:yes stop_codon:yes gene_type:complete
MKSILITGGTGLIGSSLLDSIDKSIYDVYVLTRKRSYTKNDINYLNWDPDNSILDISNIKNLYSVINLAGQSIDGSKWTDSYKKKILDSRVNSTKLLYNKIKKRKQLPKSFISASATGYYKQNTTKPQTENDDSGNNFLSNVVEKWEKEILRFNGIGVRTTVLRIGLVLSKDGGVLKRLYPLFKLFLGVPIGTGKQMISWIHLFDMVGIIKMAIEDKSFEGTYNAVAPERITNIQFTNSLLKVLNRFSYPSFVKAPSFIVKLIFGEQSELVLNGLNISSEKLIQSNYKLKFTEFYSAIREIYTGKN